jgi:hypothetical protein
MSQGKEVVAFAASNVEYHIAGPEPSQVPHKREPVIEQPLWVTMRFGRTAGGASIKERPDVSGVV